MATKKVSPRHKTTLSNNLIPTKGAREVTSEQKERLRKSVWHLLVDFNLIRTGSMTILATIVSTRLNKAVSNNTLAMALSGYRLTAPYVEYLRALKKHLQTCKRDQTNPVSLYTEPPLEARTSNLKVTRNGARQQNKQAKTREAQKEKYHE